MRVNAIAIITLAAAAIAAAGCHSRTLDQSEFRYALDDYYRAQPHCLWSSPVNFPNEGDKGNPEQARQFKALTDAGVLVRRTGTRGGVVVTEYNLSAQGQTQWTADKREPGWGNFCFARAQVTSIDRITPPTAASIAHTITYHYASDIPDWAKDSAVRSAFPQIVAEDGGAATATLVRAGSTLQVQNVRAVGSDGN
jgi:hypothetical protein